MIKLANINLHNKRSFIFKNIELNLTAPNFYILTGENNSGKSLFLKLLGLQIAPTTGQLTVFNDTINFKNNTQIQEVRRQIGFIFDEPKLLADLNVFDNVALPLRISGEKEKAIKEKTESMLSWAGLSNKMLQMPNTLSSSEQKLANIARAVIKKPKILLADELFKDLDENISKQFMMLFKELTKQNILIIAATHNTTWAKQLHLPILQIEKQSIKVIEG